MLLVLAFGLGSILLHAQVLPPPPLDHGPKLPVENWLFVRGFQFEGNTAFTQGELAQVTEPFTFRAITSEELEEARRAVTLHYINHGYLNSGAVIPDQNPTNGVITLRVVEGVLSGIELEGNRWMRDGYIEGHLQRWAGAPLNMNDLREGLQLLRQNPNVQQVNAELKPGIAPGESILDLRVQDQQPFRVGLQIDNQRPPTVGAYEFWLLASDLNLTGLSDPLDFKYGIANAGPQGIEWSGANNLEGSYLLPFTSFDTTLGIHGSRLNTSLVEEPFNDLNVTSLSTELGVTLRQPFFQTANGELALGIGFDHRRNKTWLLDEPFTISPGAEDGEMAVSVFRASQEWLQRGQDHVLALRSTFKWGLDALEATDNGIPGDPDATFFSWLGQAQFVQRLLGTQNQLVLRLAGQWTGEPLLALEQMSVGGFETVRGYLENQLVRDRGIVSSLELRLPVAFNKAGAGVVHLAPFFDFGGGWNAEDSPSPSTIYSTGVGLLLAPERRVSAQLYWGYRLRDVEIPEDAGGQGLGINFRIVVQAF
jgi:hemolysin activation/secretion protein